MLNACFRRSSLSLFERGLTGETIPSDTLTDFEPSIVPVPVLLCIDSPDDSTMLLPWTRGLIFQFSDWGQEKKVEFHKVTRKLRNKKCWKEWTYKRHTTMFSESGSLSAALPAISVEHTPALKSDLSKVADLDVCEILARFVMVSAFLSCWRWSTLLVATMSMTSLDTTGVEMTTASSPFSCHTKTSPNLWVSLWQNDATRIENYIWLNEYQNPPVSGHQL